MVNELKFLDALKDVSNIMSLVKRSEHGQIRANVRLASKQLKKLERKLSKGGWEDWEKEMYEDVVKAFGEQLKNLMTKK